MDKKNPHNNLPQGIPPPDPTQHAAEVADFSAIKQGFEASVRGLTPPKFLWDTIDQELKADLPTDAPEAFSSIKQGFESSFQLQSAPSFAWEALEHKDVATSSDDYSVIKQSFEHQYGSIIVPLFSWDDLTQRMEQDALNNDTPDQYSRVREGYAAFYATHHPVTAVWQRILQQLHPRTAWWQTHKHKVGSLLAVLVLAGVSLWGWTTQNTTAKQGVLATTTTPSLELATREATTKQTAQTATEEPPINLHQALKQNAWWAFQPTAIKTADGHPLVSEAMLAEALTAAPSNSRQEMAASSGPPRNTSNTAVSQLAVSAAAQTTTTINADHQRLIANGDQGSNDPVSSTAVQEEPTKQVVTPLAGVPPTHTPAGIVAHTLPVERALLTLPTTEQAQLTAPSTDRVWMEGIDALELVSSDQLLSTQWQEQITDSSIDFVERNSFSTTHQPLQGKRLRIEFGVVGRLGTSMLVRPKSHWHNRSIRDFGPSTALGLTGQIYLGKNDAFTLSGYPVVMTWHGLKEERGPEDAQWTDVEFSFMELALGYQRVLWHYSLIGEMPSRVYARAELGAAWMTRSNTHLNHGPEHQAAWYTNLQYSAGLSFGTTHTLGNLVVDYGITGNLGLNSIVSPQHPSLADPTRLFQAGGYLSLRYLLTPRLAPSKRMRQFDWSPPFYIEEPVY